MKMLYMNEEFQCGTGVVVPGKGMFSVHDSTMHDFTQCPVFEACGGCKDRQGGECVTILYVWSSFIFLFCCNSLE